MPSRPWPATADVYVGLDLGTSGLKGVAVDLAGTVIARGHARYATHRPTEGASEQDPADWLTATATVVAQLLVEVPAERWAGIGLSAMLPTLVTLDGEARAIGPAITWEDGRAEEYGTQFRTTSGADELYRRTGQWVDGRYLIPMWQRLYVEEPARAAATTTLLAAKDFLLHHLTGQLCTDPSTAAGFGCYDLRVGSWDDALTTLAGPLPQLPTVVPSDHILGLLPDIADSLGLAPGLPVCVGAADSVLGALGMGARQAGDVAYVAGTSTVILGVTDELILDAEHRFLVTPMAAPGQWGLEMDLLATGSALRWLADLLGVDDEPAAVRLAAESNAVASPVFLPYVAPGEQGALWDPTLTGTLLGLNLSHQRGDLVLALVQGIVIESVRCLAALESVGFERRPLYVAGGSATDPWFRQQLADASGRPILTPTDGDSDYSALGAAALVAQAVGGIAFDGGALSGVTVEPASDSAPHWAAVAARHERAREAVQQAR